ncbi:protein IQ-DOMAIN 1-like [Benincasa hispida]|uniref:protein IQ-DOMAIN 1-like n=1 Tax=Benincasa hispida TaxID=102211 RepID=UPI0018FF1596|nr:protein IQ-DOMAIN 1-like [Benincasa hispida]
MQTANFSSNGDRFSAFTLLPHSAIREVTLHLPEMKQRLRFGCAMSPANCFWTIFKQRKVKHFTSNGEQVHVKTGKSNGFPNEKSEDLAATRIQNAFRTFTARKDVNNSKVPERCQDLIQGETATKQVLSFIHSWNRMQQEIRARRLCMVTEYRVKQKKLENQLKLEAKIHELEAEWCGGSETKEEILFKIQQREEAAVRRERAMAYAFSHQWRANSILDLSPASYSLDKENWGWSWKERWIAARPWEIRANTHPTIPKKVQTKQTSKLNKVTYQPGSKVSNLARHSLSNSEGRSKARNSAIPNC